MNFMRRRCTVSNWRAASFSNCSAAVRWSFASSKTRSRRNPAAADVGAAAGRVRRRVARGCGQLAKGQKLMKTVADNPPITPADKWRIAGTSVQKVDGADFVTGKHKYSSDMISPGLLRGRVLRPSAFGAKLTSLDSKEAETISGVTVVHDGDFVGVVAPDTLAADRALRKIRAEWKTEPQISDAELFDHLKKTAR